MSKENKLIPELRFSEFVNDGEWHENLLKDHCHNISSGSNINHFDGKFDLYGSTGIIGRTNYGNYDGKYILVARVGANAGFLNKVIGQFGVTDNTLVVNLQNPEMLEFIFYSLDRIGLNKLVFGSGQPLVTGKQLKELNIPIPINPKEQQKIAACLSSLDELIAAHKDKLEALKDHKKGLMQNLFPQEGETVPKIRFPEFEGDGEWIIVQLEDFIEVIDGDRGKNYPNSNELTENGYCVFLSAKNVTADGFAFSEVQFVSKNKDKLLRKGKLMPNDVVLTTRGTLGQFAFFNSRVPYEHLRINSGMVLLRVKKKLLPEYFYSYCNSELISKTITNTAYGNAVQQLTVSGIKRFPLLFPNNINEQQKIASCLSAVDNLITAQQEKIEQLQQHKKGLMQGLFPRIEN